jgi:hypothetical protein
VLKDATGTMTMASSRGCESEIMFVMPNIDVEKIMEHRKHFKVYKVRRKYRNSETSAVLAQASAQSIHPYRLSQNVLLRRDS